jgi:hypothetical protein
MAIDGALRPHPRERGTIAELHAALQAALVQVGDEPGIVTGAWARGSEADADRQEPFAARASPAPKPDDFPDGLQDGVPGGIWPARALGAAGAAAFGAWTAERLLAPSPLPPAAAALLAGAAVLLLPRIGWLALAVALTAGAALRGHPGAALVIALAALAPVLLVPTRPTAWPLPAAAPALGLIGLAGAWPALAARAGRAGPMQRAALGAIGWVWLLLAQAVLGRLPVLYLPHVSGVPPPAAWLGSLPETTGHLLAALGSSGVLAPAAVWALAAMTAPWLVRGRTLALDVVRVVAWSALVLSATSAAMVAANGTDTLGSAPTAVLGAAACAVVVLAPRGIGGWRRAWHSVGDVGARLP